MKGKLLITTALEILFLLPFADVATAQGNAWIFPGVETKATTNGFLSWDMYRFGNMQNVFDEALDSSALIEMFGQAAVCQKPPTPNGQCVMRKDAEAWRKAQVELMRGRHAEGMIVTAMRNFLEKNTEWKNGLLHTYDGKFLGQRNQGFIVENTIELKPNFELDNYISYYQTLKELEVVYNDATRQASYGWSPQEFVNRLIDSLNRKHTFYTIELGAYGGRSYRPLLPMEVYRMGRTPNYRISVYDANCPEIPQNLLIATDSGRMFYQPCNGRAEDFGGRRTLTPITARFPVNNRKFICPFGKGRGPAMAEGSSDDDDTDYIHFSFNGSGNLLITDPNSKKIGYDGMTKKEVNQVPDARVIYDDGSAESVFSPRYALPYDYEATAPYRILMSGDDLKKESNGNLTVTGPGFVVGFENISLDPKEKLAVSISADGKTLSFTASADRETPTLYVTTGDGPNNPSYSFKIGGVMLAAGKTLAMTVNVEEGKVTFQDNDGKKNAYDIDFRRLDRESDEIKFIYADLKLAGKDSYEIDINRWDDGTKPCVKDDEGNSLSDDDCGTDEDTDYGKDNN